MTAMKQPLTDDHVFLIGRPPLEEYLGFLTVQCVDGASADLRVLAEEWRSANDHVRELEATEAGWADDAPILGLPGGLAALAAEVMANPIIQTCYGVVPNNIAMVELDRLVVSQKDINLMYARQIEATLGTDPTEEQIFELCLPFGAPPPVVEAARIANNGYMFLSQSNDLRFLEPTLLDAQSLIGHKPRGVVAGIVALPVGFSPNCLSVISVEKRLILNNGSHRAYALRDLGITHVPAIIQTVTRREELPVCASELVQQQPDRYLKDPRPPVLKDYFDPKLRKIVTVVRRLRQVKIAFGVEPLDVPAARG